MSKTQKKVEEEEEESGGAMAVVGHHPPLLLHLHLPCLTLLFLSFFFLGCLVLIRLWWGLKEEEES